MERVDVRGVSKMKDEHGVVGVSQLGANMNKEHSIQVEKEGVHQVFGEMLQ